MNNSKIKNLLIISRELVDSILDNKKNDIRKEHTYMFTVSRFIAQKENIIKKKFDKNKISLNLVDEKYLPIIYYIYYKYGKNIDLNNQNNIYLDNDLLYNGSNEYKAINFFSKIRDAFCHGKYYFDIEHESIVIDNKEFNMYFELPIYEFDYISFYINEIYSDRTKTYIEIESKYKANLNNGRLSNIYKNIDKDKAMEFAKLINIELKELSKELNNSNTKTRTSSSNSDEEEINEYDLIQELVTTIDNLNMSEENKSKLKSKIYDFISRKHDIDKLFSLICDVEVSLNVDMEQTLLFNHSNIVFNHTSPYTYTVTYFPRDKYKYEFDREHEHECKNRIKKVQETCKKFIEAYKNNNNPDIDDAKKNLRDTLINIESCLFTSDNSFTKSFARSIRNGIEHCNIEGKNKNITIFDKSDNIDTSNSNNKFELYTNIYEYNNYLRCLEKPKNDISLIDIFKYTSEEFNELFYKIYYLVTNNELDPNKTVDDIRNEFPEKQQ